MIPARGDIVMANYTTNASDKSKKIALKFWLIGVLGLLGLENFYVGKFKKGLQHVAVGVIYFMTVYVMISTKQYGLEYLAALAVFWMIISLPNLFKILLGVFKDNLDQPLRQ